MISTQLKKLVTSLSPKEQNATLLTLKKIFNNIIQHPNDDKYRQIKLISKTLTSKVWQYPAGEELMKMSGWVVESDHVRLRDDSCVRIVSQLLKSFLSSSATGVVPFPNDEFQVLIKALYNGDIACIQKLLKVSHISPNGRIYSESGSSLNLLKAATISQQLDIVKLLLTDYSMDPYVVSMREDDMSFPYIEYIFYYAPQSFIIAIMKHCGIKIDFKTTDGNSLLHLAVAFNCFDVVSFLLEQCSGIDVNVTTDDDLVTPLHVAYLCGHTQIAQYLIQHDADVYAMNSDGHTPYEYIDGYPDYIKQSEYFQNERKIHHIPYSIEHCYYMKLRNIGTNDKEAVSLTMGRFPSLKEVGPTQPHHDIDHASALKEFTQFITSSTQRSTNDSRKQPPSEQSEVKGKQAKISTDHPWGKPRSTLQSIRHLL